MPIYEYHCSQCGDFEVMQRISDKELRTCPTCRRKVTKLISNTTFHLKGSGWYITDYARKGQGAGTEADKKSDATAETKAETKAEATAEAKAEATAEAKPKSDRKRGDASKKSPKAKSAA